MMACNAELNQHRFSGKIVKKLAPELAKVLNGELQGQNDENRLYVKPGGGTWA